MASQYIYDDKQVRFKKTQRTISGVLFAVLKYTVLSLALAVLYYSVFALLFNTDTERRLKQENRLYEKIYPEMEKKERLLSDVVTGLQMRDDEIYNEVFHMSAPNVERLSSVSFLEDTKLMQDDDIAEMTSAKVSVLETRASRVEDNFRRVFERISGEDFVMPPMDLPINDFTYAQAGATVGQKISPFYKVKVEHRGFDLIAHSGTPVYSTASGVVTDVVRSAKGPGNMVQIQHGGGYVTRYAHLQDIAVAKGRQIEKGTLIGHVGVTGMTFAPHLHYEVSRDGEYLNPVNYFLGAVSPYEYSAILVMSISTGQSMD